MIPQKAVSQLQDLFFSTYGIKLTDQEALYEAYDLLYIYAFGIGRFDLLESISALQSGDIV